MSAPYYADDAVTLHHGDCLDVLRALPDNSVDAVVTDPPYNLSDSGKRDRDCLRKIVADVLLPYDQQRDAEGGQGGHLASPSFGGAPLRGVHGAVGEDARVGMPEGAVDLKHSTIVEAEVGAGDEPTPLATDGDLPLMGDAYTVKLAGDFILQSTDGGDSTLCYGTCGCFTEPSAGVIAVSVVVPQFAGGDGAGNGIVIGGRNSNVGRGHDARREAESATPVHARRGAVRRAVLRLDLRGGAGELDLTDRTLDHLPAFALVSTEAIGATAGTRRLSPMAKPHLIRLVGDSTDGTFTLYQVAHGINSTTGGFMGKAWDGWSSPAAFQRWCAAWSAECLRVLKPGGHLLTFGGSRTWHRLAVAVEDAGFEIRDSIAWLYGSGFPKSLDVSKAIDKRGGNAHLASEIGAAIKAARESRGWTTGQADRHFCGGSTNWTWYEGRKGMCRPPTPADFARIAAEWPELASLAAKVAEVERSITQAEVRPLVQGEHISFDQRSSTERERRDIPETEAAQQWQGWGTALKPAFEPIVVGRKPFPSTVAANILEHGTGALNIDGCRVGNGGQLKWATPRGMGSENSFADDAWTQAQGRPHAEATASVVGRWPTNVVLDESQAVALDQETGLRPSGGSTHERSTARQDVFNAFTAGRNVSRDADTGGASRFFPVFKYQAKAPTKERPKVEGVAHPTVKPLELMRWLVRLVTPPGGTVLEPFAGSGTTAEACLLEGVQCIAIEREADYLPLIVARLTKHTQAALDFGGAA